MNKTKRNTKYKRQNKTQKCYNRTKNNNAIVDTHLHLQPFGGKSIPFIEMLNILHNSGILFIEGEGIGQKIFTNKKCDHYLNCPKSIIKPSIENDILNAENLKTAISKNYKYIKDIKINLSMTFPDLSKPETIVKKMKFLEKKYPNFFGWMGEVNLVKQSLFNNKFYHVPINIIKKWKPFMSRLIKKNMPLSLHCDLGNDNDNFKYLPLILEILNLYPKNKIVWMHLGLSRELKLIDSKTHVELLDNLLKKYHNLYFDISWSILYDQKFFDKKERDYYINLLNKWPKRFLPGTDFIGSINKTSIDYKNSLKKTSNILKYVNNNAFRCIALGQNYFDLLGLDYKAPKIC